MADGDTVKMKLSFWRGDQPPETVIDVPAGEVHRWRGYATPVAEATPTPEPKPVAKTTPPSGQTK
ncbi:hypothetical protein ACFVT5_41300 [Streptomyces sp. NPDC058001]|uniref:hypothetical protein n=1 Tax=Streptomyces sp. NPDC058001 TaxID=3346300 RepID=UPI0036E5FE71